MVVLVAPFAAALIAVAAPKYKHSKHRHIVHMRVQARGQGTPEAVARRVARMTRLAVLLRREALLHDFIIGASTEKPILRDDVLHAVQPDISISATRVTLDFLGNPIVRARIRSASPTLENVVLVADVVDASGAHGRAALAVALQPGETRIVELLCPEKLLPVSVSWSTMPL